MEDAPHPPGHCPVCGVAVGLGPRYPHALCVPCRQRATDLAGRGVALHSGAGFFARFRDDGSDCEQVTRDGRVLVDGQEFEAHEDYHGGVAVVWRPRPSPEQRFVTGSQRTWVPRCPECGSTAACADESRSRLEFTFMHCPTCGHGGLVDSWQRDDEWFVDVDLAAHGGRVPDRLEPLLRSEVAGCGACRGADAEVAWAASRSTRLARLVDESHFGVSLTQCACGQRFAVVFTERIDWHGGEDDQTWLVVPIAAGEQDELQRTAIPDVPAALTRLAAGRRFLVRSHPTAGPLAVWWRDQGFAIGPHD